MKILFSFLLLTISFTSTAQIPSYVPTNGLVGYWPFNGNANDESGNGNNGVVNGATLTSDRFGVEGKAYSFGDNFIQVPNSAILSNMNAISISAWVHIQNWHYFSGVGYFPIVHKSDQQFQYGKWAMGIRDVGPYCHLDNQETGFGFTSWNFNQWYQITTVISSDTSKLYINGQLIYSIRSGVFPQIPNQNLPLTIGMDRPGLVDYARGKIDDIAIYNRALTQQEITQLYTSTNIPTTSEDTTSNVGIGTVTPKRKLHVNDVMRLEPRNTAPVNPGEGDIYYDAILKKLRYYNGTNWISL